MCRGTPSSTCFFGQQIEKYPRQYRLRSAGGLAIFASLKEHRTCKSQRDTCVTPVSVVQNSESTGCSCGCTKVWNSASIRPVAAFSSTAGNSTGTEHSERATGGRQPRGDITARASSAASGHAHPPQAHPQHTARAAPAQHSLISGRRCRASRQQVDSKSRTSRKSNSERRSGRSAPSPATCGSGRLQRRTERRPPHPGGTRPGPAPRRRQRPRRDVPRPAPRQPLRSHLSRFKQPALRPRPVAARSPRSLRRRRQLGSEARPWRACPAA